MIDDTNEINAVEAVVRVRMYGKWPSAQRVELPNQVTTFQDAEGEARYEYSIVMNIGMMITDFANPPDCGSNMVGDMMLTIDKANSFYLGNTVYGPIGSPIAQLRSYAVRPGEADIILRFNTGDLVRLCKNANHLANLAEIAAYIIARVSKDLVIPIEGPTVYAVSDQKRSGLLSTQAFKICQLERREYSTDDVLIASEIACSAMSKMEPSQAITVATAIRRINSGSSETDDVDAFCDYWEACEFLSQKRKPLYTGGRAEIIAKYISHHVFAKESETLRNKKAAELCAKIIRPLYDIRINLVHHLGENSAEVTTAIPIISEVAHGLLAIRLGASYQLSASLARLLTIE